MNGLNLNDITSALDGVVLEDQSISTGGGFTARRLPIGKHPVRLVRYIELGDHPQKAYQGVEKPDAPMVAMTFEFLGKKTVTEATDDKPEHAMQKTIVIKKSSHEKAAYRKLFDKMRMGNTGITNMVQMVGIGSWLIDVNWTQGRTVLSSPEMVAEAEAKNKANPDDKDLRIWDNIRTDEGFSIGAPIIQRYDQETGETTPVPIKVREPISDLSVFLWDNPNPVFWASIFIGGSYTKKVGEVEEEISKNRWQNQCIEATNYAGSPLQSMLDGTDSLGECAVAEPVPETPAEPEDAPVASEEAAPVDPDKFTQEDADLLAELGL